MVLVPAFAWMTRVLAKRVHLRSAGVINSKQQLAATASTRPRATCDVVTRLHPLLLLAESSYRRCKRDVAPAADPMSAPAKSIGEVQWSQPATKGDKPAPRSGHTITVRELRSVAPSPAPSNRLRSCSVCITL